MYNNYYGKQLLKNFFFFPIKMILKIYQTYILIILSFNVFLTSSFLSIDTNSLIKIKKLDQINNNNIFSIISINFKK